MTTTDATQTAGGSDWVDLLLPNAVVAIRGLPAMVSDALGDLASARWRPGPDAAVVDMRATKVDDSWRLYPDGDDDVWLGADTEADLLDVVVGRLNRLAFHLDPRRLHLHAAAVELDGAGVILAGASGSGKSTVTVELLRRGAAYLTDECLTVTPGTRTVTAYPKPLTLKAGSLEYFSRSLEHVVARLSSATNGRAHLRASRLGATVVPHTTVGAIVLLRYSEGETPDFRSVSPAEACVALLGDSLDGIRMGPSALDVLAPIAAGAATWELVFNNAAEAAELIADIRPPLRRELVVPQRLRASSRPAASGDPTEPGSPYRSDDESVRVVRFDTGAALHDGQSRILAVLDAAQIDAIERGDTDGPAIAQLAEMIGRPVRAVPPTDAGTPLAFGLPGRPIGSIVAATPIASADADAAATGRCTGVLAEQLVRGRHAESDALSDQVHRTHMAGQSTCLLLERELPRIVDILEVAGVRPVLLKGPVSAHDGPLPPHLRDFGDLDLLVPADQMDAAVATLLADGFERCFPQVSADFDRRFAKSVTLRRRFSGDWRDRDAPTFEVDLHRTLTPGPFGEMVALAELHAHAVPVRVHGRWYRALCPTHRFLHACLHTVLGSAEPRLHSVRDLIATAPRTPTGAADVVETAADWGVTAVVQRAARMAETTFPGGSTPELVDAIESARPRPSESVYLGSYHRRRWSYSLPAAVTVAVLPRWRDRWDFVTVHLRHRRSGGAQ